MERLTTRHNGVAVIKDKNLLKEAMEKLATYEEAEGQGLLLRLPCKVSDVIDKIFSHNQIVSLWYDATPEHPHYRIWKGMAWDIPEVYKACQFVDIFGTIPMTITEADTLNICIKLSEEAEQTLARMEAENV